VKEAPLGSVRGDGDTFVIAIQDYPERPTFLAVESRLSVRSEPHRKGKQGAQ